MIGGEDLFTNSDDDEFAETKQKDSVGKVLFLLLGFTIDVSFTGAKR
jgi:hypothetical protein